MGRSVACSLFLRAYTSLNTIQLIVLLIRSNHASLIQRKGESLKLSVHGTVLIMPQRTWRHRTRKSKYICFLSPPINSINKLLHIIELLWLNSMPDVHVLTQGNTWRRTIYWSRGRYGDRRNRCAVDIISREVFIYDSIQVEHF
jgi:hypothetical protein